MPDQSLVLSSLLRADAGVIAAEQSNTKDNSASQAFMLFFMSLLPFLFHLMQQKQALSLLLPYLMCAEIGRFMCYNYYGFHLILSQKAATSSPKY
jgi:hypothetical protein